MDDALDAVLLREIAHAPLAHETAAFFAEMAYRRGRIDDALRLVDIAHHKATRMFEAARGTLLQEQREAAVA